MSFKAVVDPGELEKIIDLMFTNTDKPEVQVKFDGLLARNLDPSRITVYDLSITQFFFDKWEVEKEGFIRLTDRKRAKEAIRALKAAKAPEATFSAKEGKVFIDETIIGEVDPELTEFEAKEFRFEYTNWALFDGRDFKRWLSSSRRAGADHVGITFLEFEAKIDAFNEEVWLSVKPLDVRIEAPNYSSAYDLTLIEQFLPPSVFLRKGWPPIHLHGMDKFIQPTGLDFDYGPQVKFTAHIAPNTENSVRVMRKYGLLKPLTKQTILDRVKFHWETEKREMTRYELHDSLRDDGWDVEPLNDMVKELVEEGRLKERRVGWQDFYSLPEVVVELKPLTEDVVLAELRRLEEAIEDYVGYSELEVNLSRKGYEVDPLHGILLRLKDRDLIEVTGFRARPGIVEMRGYWRVKVPVPPPPVPPPPPIKRWRKEGYTWEVNIEARRYRILYNERVVKEWTDLTVTPEEMANTLKQEGWELVD